MDVTSVIGFVLQIGPGITHLFLDSPLAKGVIVQTFTPSEPLHQVFTHKIYSSWKFSPCLAKLVLLGESIQVSIQKRFEPRQKKLFNGQQKIGMRFKDF